MDNEKLKREIRSFSNLWKGGTTPSRVGWEQAAVICKNTGQQNMYKIHEICIEPYTDNAVILDIGTNGGAWLTKMQNAKKLIGIDVLSAEHTGFWKNIPTNIREKVDFFQVTDFECDFLNDNSIDYVFSYDVFCHMSYSGAESYLKNLYNKLKPGANCFIMIADPIKYQDMNGRKKLMKIAGFNNWDDFVNDYDGEPNNGRWYFYGVEKFSELLKKYNYDLISKDVIGPYDPRSPIIHFRKPNIL